jgi:hypothetical protein
MKRMLATVCTAMLGLAACAHAKRPASSAFSCKVSGHYVIVTLSGTRIEGTRNPKYFGVSFGDDFIYLDYPPAHADFTPYDAHTRELKLDIASQHGIRYDNGVSVDVLAFARPGRYRLLFADDLETEPDNTFSLQCQVQLPASAD